VSMAEITPSERGSKAATFRGLIEDFKLDEKVLALLMKSPMDNLEDLRFYFTDEKEIDGFLAEDPEMKDHALRLQVSRLRRAWSAVRQTAIRKESRQSVTTASELDDLLCETDLRNIKVQFWKRYKLRYPAEFMPCDQIVSRCFREVDRRMLTVYDVWKVRSLKHQVTSSRKRKQVGEGLYTFEDDAQVEPIRSANIYLENLYTYLLALAITGSVRRTSAPTEETFGSDPVKFVAAPWDVLQAYYFRAVTAVAAIPEVSRVAWLERTDTAERAVWVSTFRDSDDSIGEVIKETMDRRGAHWDPPAVAAPSTQFQAREIGRVPTGEGKGQQQGPGNGRRKKGGKQNSGAPALTPGTVAAGLKDGKQLCADYQRGSCPVKGPQCQKGLHRCGKVTPKGRICGMNFHGAHQCWAK